MMIRKPVMLMGHAESRTHHSLSLSYSTQHLRLYGGLGMPHSGVPPDLTRNVDEFPVHAGLAYLMR